MYFHYNKKIFVSYRRDDDGAYLVPELNRRLSERYGKESVFYDIDNIPLGVDFRDHLNDAISTASIVLVVIGDRWMGRDAHTGLRRIDRDDDFVRIEVEAALSRSIPVVPILVGRAMMPQEKDLPPSIAKLAYRNAAEIRTAKDYEAHISTLLRNLDGVMNYIPHDKAEKNAAQSITKISSNEDAETKTRIYENIRLEYWTDLLRAARKKTSLHAKVSPKARQYAQTSIARGFDLVYVSNSYVSWVELYIHVNAGEESKTKTKNEFHRIKNNRMMIENKFGAPLDWQELPERIACRICFHIKGGTKSPRDDWPQIHEQMITAMIRLHEALSDEIANI